MKTDCQTIQRALAEDGPAALQLDERAQDHVAECEDCFGFLEAIAEVEDGLAALVPIDPPDELVERLLSTLRERESSPERGALFAGAPPARWLASIRSLLSSRSLQLATATAAVLTLTFLMVPRLLAPRLFVRTEPMFGEEPPHIEAQTGQQVGATGWEAESPRTEELENARRLEALGYLSEDVDGRVAANQLKADPRNKPDRERRNRESKDDDRFSFRRGQAADDEMEEFLPDLQAQRETFRDRVAGSPEERPAGSLPEDRRSRVDSPAFPEPQSKPAPAEKGKILGGLTPGSELADATLDRLESGARWAEGLAYSNEQDLEGDEVGAGGKKSESSLPGSSESEPLGPEDKQRDMQGEHEELERVRGRVSDVSTSFGDVTRARGVAERFLRERERIEGLVFRPASGYWANTYVPGDPFLRLLYSRLRGARLESLWAAESRPVALHDDVSRLAQPFDPPQNAALAVYLHSDRTHLEGRQRLLLQVGLQGTPRSSGRRGAMNVGLVLDLGGELEAQSAAAVRALVEAFGEARDIGDRFHLVAAGRSTETSDGVVVKPEAFRHGPLRLAIEGLLAPPSPDGGAGLSDAPGSSVLDLYQAMETAMDRVAGGQDPSATLGTSVVVLVTARPLAERFEALRRLVHTSAIAGVPVSVIGIGDRVDPDELEQLALWGQGSRRLLEAAAGAEALVERELAAASRTVARAVRLRIRLAAGVELIDVIGSRRLDEEDSRRVREAENNIDLRLARNLGIAADRGEDEEGIQIVMPGFVAGDSHVILLDVLATGPGAVADVTVRYKDLVHLRNGVGRAHLELPRAERPVGALEINVLENLLAHRLFEDLDAAGQGLRAGDVEAARERLAKLRDLLVGVMLLVTALDGDASLEADVALLDQYLSVLDRPRSVSERQRALLADSLRLSGRLKVSSPPSTLAPR